MRNGNLQLIGLTGLIMGLAGCNYVTTGERTNQLNCLDQDGDGAVAAADLCDRDGVIDDCNDSRATGANETPGAEEIPYDGWDNDCGRLDNEPQPDLVDVDGDGYPGILKSEWEQIASSTVSWPGGLRETLDCDDTSADVNPSAVDRPYDGVDSDCQGDDDYDRDDDGYVPDPEDIEGEPGYVPYEGDKPAGDCNDFSGQFYPGANDTPYDGEDRDCAGNDDYDADGDGHRSSEQVGTGTDCDDTNANINPDASDTPYDGIDSDCDGANDYDLDEDGYVPDQYDSVDPDDLPTGDCNDNDAGVFPGNLEIFLDGVDQDCDGGEGATFVAPLEHRIEGPRRPELRVQGDEFILSLGGDSVGNRIGDVNDGGMALWFPGDSGASEQPSGEFRWKSNGALSLFNDFGFEATTSTLVWAYTTSGGGSGTNGLVTTYVPVSSGQVGNPTSSFHVTGNSAAKEAVTADVATRNGQFFAASCGPDQALYNMVDPNSTATAPQDKGYGSFGCDQMLMSVSGSGDLVHTYLGGTNASLKVGGASISSATARYALTGVASMRSHAGLGVIGLSGGGVVIDDGSTSSSHLSGLKIIQADAVKSGGVVYIAAIINDGGTPEIVLAEIDGTKETVVDLVWPDTFDPVGVTVEATADRLMVAAVGSDGATKGSIHWAFHEL